MSDAVPSVLSYVPPLAALRGLRNAITRVATRHGASNVRVFGSVARGTAGPASDVDLLVDLASVKELRSHEETAAAPVLTSRPYAPTLLGCHLCAAAVSSSLVVL